MIVALMAVAPAQDAPISASTEDASMRAMPTIEEPDAVVVIVKPPTAPIELAISRAPSMPEIGSEGQRLVVHDMSELDKFMHNFIKIRQGWKDKVVATVAKKSATLQHLQAASDKIKVMEEWEKKNEEEYSYLKIELESAWSNCESARVGLESAQANLESTDNDLDVVHAKIGIVRLEVLSLRDDKKIKERKKQKSFKAKVASTQATLDRTKEQALEEFRGSKNFKEKLVVANCLAYRIKYEDGRNAVDRFYPNLDVTQVPLSDSDEEDGLAENVSTDHLASNEVAPIEEVVPTLILKEKTSEPSLTEEERASAMAIVNVVIVDD
ncbi:hypothetical protein COCNU_16G007800 [Cocos nucifera]|uniref:Uncharacterized protein n=1 Tax=Cocos nucifera TaxID=13894 RepID=A0A8K0IYY7_COCNU|nr:hypothetical protein COCNU_16G007800 [Cocos nucifera]